jgi:hypothetical protein
MRRRPGLPGLIQLLYTPESMEVLPMTEWQWTTWTDVDKLLNFLRGKTSNRKLRLFAAACCQRVRPQIHIEEYQQMVDLAEQFADHDLPVKEIAAARSHAYGLYFEAIDHEPRRPNDDWTACAFSAVEAALGDPREEAYIANEPVLVDAAITTTWRAVSAAEYVNGPGSAAEPWKTTSIHEMSVQAGLLRDIIGNPFRPVTLVRSWLAWNENTVLRMAQSIYDDRAFDTMPVLGDALEDAGCQNAAILSHCRQPGQHVRGCWVVDLLLEKV